MTVLKDELVNRLEQIPGLTHKSWPGRDDGFSTIHFNGKEIGHFHNCNELDLRLGKKLIKQEGLAHHPDSVNHPNRSMNSQYVELRFHEHRDLEPVVRLVNLLVQELLR